jgi:hypothetical protein
LAYYSQGFLLAFGKAIAFGEALPSGEASPLAIFLRAFSASRF